MADKEAEKPWPLMTTSVIADVEAKHLRDGVDLLAMHMDTLYSKTRKMLEAEGRMRDIRRLTLVCHNEDENIVKIITKQTGEE